MWRSDTLRLFNPQHLKNTEVGQKQLKQVDALIKFLAIGHVRDYFDQQSMQCLLRVMDNASFEKFTDELTQLFTQAGQLSVRLWSQRPALKCLYLDEFAAHQFKAGSDVLQPHLLHKHSDPLDTSLDGILPKIIIHPAIMISGTHEAEDYDQSRVLEKAVVWLDV